MFSIRSAYRRCVWFSTGVGGGGGCSKTRSIADCWKGIGMSFSHHKEKNPLHFLDFPVGEFGYGIKGEIEIEPKTFHYWSPDKFSVDSREEQITSDYFRVVIDRTYISPDEPIKIKLRMFPVNGGALAHLHPVIGRFVVDPTKDEISFSMETIDI